VQNILYCVVCIWHRAKYLNSILFERGVLSNFALPRWVHSVMKLHPAGRWWKVTNYGEPATVQVGVLHRSSLVRVGVTIINYDARTISHRWSEHDLCFVTWRYTYAARWPYTSSADGEAWQPTLFNTIYNTCPVSHNTPGPYK